MTVRSFVDSNVLLYADDVRDQRKQVRAADLIEELIRSRSGVLSLQVLREYFVIATRKLGVSAELAAEKVRLFAAMEHVRDELDDLFSAIDLHRLRGYSLWDCLIVRAAVKAGCKRLYSEDLQHGQFIDGVEIVNPFLPLSATR